MAEKRGDTGKLECPFNQDGSLEIFNKKGNWSRVTSREFRSFDGPRRIYQPKEVIRGHGNLNVEMEYVDFYGPIFAYGTNTQVPFKDTKELVNSKVLEEARIISEERFQKREDDRKEIEL